jgi:hypothetical protein
MVYWVRFEFEGKGSGLDSAVIDSEVQMSPWSMPGLEYGVNRIRFEAEDMGRSRLHVTYAYDANSPFTTYESATGQRGRHIPLRIGGVLQQGSKLNASDYRKAAFWRRITESPGERVQALLQIYKVSGPDTGKLVRTLVNRRLYYGSYKFYWNGKDDTGVSQPVGMYAYKLTLNGTVVHGERLYLYYRIWPMPNEIVNGVTLSAGG